MKLLIHSLKYLTLVLLFGHTVAFAANENTDTDYQEGQTIYVADNVNVWTRRGPSSDYRIIGSQHVGDALTFIQYSQSKAFSKVRNENNEEIWIESKYLQKDPSGYSKEAILNKQIEDLEYRLANYDNELSQELQSTKTKLARLQKENAQQKETINQKDETIAQLDEQRRDYLKRLETKDLDMQMRWWTQGALIAVAGMIVGVILIYLPRPNKKKNKNRF